MVLPLEWASPCARGTTPQLRLICHVNASHVGAASLWFVAVKIGQTHTTPVRATRTSSRAAMFEIHRLKTSCSCPGSHQGGAVFLAALAAMLLAGGCSSNKICLRSVPKSPLVEQFDLASYSGPKASTRTVQLLRVYNLTNDVGIDARPLLPAAAGDQRSRAFRRQGVRAFRIGVLGRQESGADR